MPPYIFQELGLVFSSLYFASTHLRVVVVFLSGICIQKADIFPHNQNYPTSETYSNLLLFHSSFSPFSNEASNFQPAVTETHSSTCYQGQAIIFSSSIFHWYIQHAGQHENRFKSFWKPTHIGHKGFSPLLETR